MENNAVMNEAVEAASNTPSELVENTKKKKWLAIWDKITTGLLIALMASPVLILLYIFLWFIMRG